MSEIGDLLRDACHREREQAVFYRALSGLAQEQGDDEGAERLNELLADEQHHISRLTARLIEIGEAPEPTAVDLAAEGLEGWRVRARIREEREVAWYEAALGGELDRETRAVLAVILESEIHHRDELAGKWMPAVLRLNEPGSKP